MVGQRTIKVPLQHYKNALQLKKTLAKEKNLNIPLWRCMIAIEETKHNNDPFQVFK